MSKIKYILEETVVYHHEVTVEGTIADMEKALDKLDECDHLDDLLMEFKNSGCEVCEVEEDQDGESKELDYHDEISLDEQ